MNCSGLNRLSDNASRQKRKIGFLKKHWENFEKTSNNLQCRFKSKEIPFPEDYSLEKNRASLQTIFTFSYLKTYGGANLDAIGFLGRNFRYCDYEEFYSSKYFIQRYISDATLKLELRFILVFAVQQIQRP